MTYNCRFCQSELIFDFAPHSVSSHLKYYQCRNHRNNILFFEFKADGFENYPQNIVAFYGEEYLLEYHELKKTLSIFRFDKYYSQVLIVDYDTVVSPDKDIDSYAKTLLVFS